MLKVKCDIKGRIYLREKLRARYGDEFILVERLDGFMFLPIPENPVQDLEELGKKLRGHSIKEIKRKTEKRSLREVEA